MLVSLHIIYTAKGWCNLLIYIRRIAFSVQHQSVAVSCCLESFTTRPLCHNPWTVYDHAPEAGEFVCRANSPHVWTLQLRLSFNQKTVIGNHESIFGYMWGKYGKMMKCATKVRNKEDSISALVLGTFSRVTLPDTLFVAIRSLLHHRSIDWGLIFALRSSDHLTLNRLFFNSIRWRVGMSTLLTNPFRMVSFLQATRCVHTQKRMIAMASQLDQWKPRGQPPASWGSRPAKAWSKPQGVLSLLQLKGMRKGCKAVSEHFTSKSTCNSAENPDTKRGFVSD